jgi:hypothetical protein
VFDDIFMIYNDMYRMMEPVTSFQAMQVYKKQIFFTPPPPSNIEGSILVLQRAQRVIGRQATSGGRESRSHDYSRVHATRGNYIQTQQHVFNLKGKVTCQTRQRNEPTQAVNFLDKDCSGVLRFHGGTGFSSSPQGALR